MGAKKYDRIDTVAKVCTGLIFATWILLGGLTWLFGKPLLGLYTSDPAVIDLGMLRMKVMMAVMPMISTLIGACLMRIVWLTTIFAWHPTVTMLFACYPVTWALAGLGQVGSFLYARSKVRKRATQDGEVVGAVESTA